MVNGTLRSGYDIFYADRRGEGRSEPQRLSEVVNAKPNNGFPSVAADGTLYLTQQLPAGRRIMRSALVNGEYTAPVPVEISDFATRMFDGTISWDERIIVFSATHAAGFDGAPPSPGSDIYLAVKEGSMWSAPQAIAVGGTAVMRIGSALSPDGHTIYYSQNSAAPTLPRTGRADTAQLAQEFHSSNIGLYRIYEVAP